MPDARGDWAQKPAISLTCELVHVWRKDKQAGLWICETCAGGMTLELVGFMGYSQMPADLDTLYAQCLAEVGHAT